METNPRTDLRPAAHLKAALFAMIAVCTACAALPPGLEKKDPQDIPPGILAMLVEAGLVPGTGTGTATGTGTGTGTGTATGGGSGTGTGTGTGSQATTAAPSLTIGTGSYTYAQSVALSTTTGSAIICYTTGTSPADPVCDSAKTACTTGTLVSGSVSITSTASLKAIACKASQTDSSITTAAYTFIPTTPADPAAATMGGDIIQISWAPSSDADTASSSLVYEVCRATVTGGCDTFSVTYTSAAGAANMNTAALTNGSTYFFRVRAKDADTNASAVSAEVSAKAVTTPTWSQQAYLKAPNAEAGDNFGNSVGVSGNTIVVTAESEDSNQTTVSNSGSLPTPGGDNDSAAESGAAYVFVRSGTTWSQQAYLKAPNPESSDAASPAPRAMWAAISGETIVFTAIGEDSNQTTVSNSGSLPTPAGDNDSIISAGAAYVFVRSGTTWSQEAYLKAPNAEASDLFGHSVSISGDTIVVGADGESSNQTTVSNGGSLPTPAGDNDAAGGAGAAYVFVRIGTTWSQQAYLKASNAEASDGFGYSVGISGDTIVVGARLEDSNQTTVTNSSTLPTPAGDNDSVSGSGAAYVFVRAAAVWSQQAYLKAPNPEASDIFGASIAISGDSIVVGATGESSNQTTVSNSGALPTPAGDDDSIAGAGAAYVFVRSGSTWSQQAYLKAPNVEASDTFGYSVSISGDTVVVGARDEDSNQTTVSNSGALPNPTGDNDSAGDAGAAYVFVRAGTAWAQHAYLKAPNAEAGDVFGWSVFVSGDTVVVGARSEASNQTTVSNIGSLPTAAGDNDGAAAAGAAYVFFRQ